VTATADAGSTLPPQVSVLLPIRNEASAIEACLDGLRRQDYPHERLEVLVIDGRSDDGTVAIVERYAQRHPRPAIRVIDNPARTVPPALNAGLRAAQGSVIVRMDGHTVPADDYVSRCVEALERTGAGNVGGCITPRSDTPFGGAVAMAQRHPLGAGGAKFHGASEAQDTDTVYLGAFPRAVFGEVGGFDETMRRNQDYELNVRLRAAGYRVHLDPTIRSSYTPRRTPGALWTQYFQYGWWRVVTVRRHPASLRPRQAIPPAYVGAFVASGVAGLFWPAAAWLWAAIAAPYLLAVLVATGDAARRYAAPPASVVRLPVAFAILHFAWGAGFLVSLVSGSRFPYGRPGPPRIPMIGSEPS
jgi:glycosyltransferase involved in cell wall biosynthesis